MQCTILNTHAQKFDFLYTLLPNNILFLNMTIMIYRGIVCLLKLRLPSICICIYQIMFLCSSNVFCNFPADNFFFQACFLPDIYLDSYILFLFYFLNNEEIHDYSYMMCHMIPCHRPKMLWKKLEEIMSRYMCIVYLSHG